MTKRKAIASSDTEIYFFELDAVAHRIRQHPFIAGVEYSILIIHADQYVSTLQILAACWIAGIPFLILHPSDDFNPSDEYTDLGLHPSLFITTCSDISIDIPFLHPDEFLRQVMDCAPSALPEHKTDDIALILSTSGSTGSPKEVVFKRKQLIAAAESSQQFMQPATGNSWLLNLPLNHAGGLGILIRCLIWKSSVWFSNTKNTHDIAQLLRDHPTIDTISLVPTQLHRLLVDGFIDPLSKLKTILIGAGSVSDGDLAIINKHKLPVRQSFGMTETFGHFTLSDSASYIPLSVSNCGKPLHDNEIQIRDDNGKPVSPSTSGYLWIQGDQLFDHYLGSNTSLFDDGWFQTSDFGYIDEKGHFFFEARRTDIIKTGGESVNAVLVNQALKDLDGIDDAFAIGLSDDEWGQRVHACLVSQSAKQYTLDELRLALRNQLKPYELPRSISWHSSIPRNAMGKMDLTALLLQIKTA